MTGDGGVLGELEVDEDVGVGGQVSPGEFSTRGVEGTLPGQEAPRELVKEQSECADRTIGCSIACSGFIEALLVFLKVRYL